jgi:hypothetical protein
MGKMTRPITPNPSLKNALSGSILFGADTPSKVTSNRNIKGTMAAAIIEKYNEALRRVFKISERNELSKFMNG